MSFISQNQLPMSPIDSETEYQERLASLEQLLDEIGNNECHPQLSFLNELAAIISDYEQQHYPEPKALAQEVLAYLMAEHNLGPSDLPEVGDLCVISKILCGNLELNKRQIQVLCERFNTSEAVFF